MNIKELTFTEFFDFANNHELSNYYQSLNYALLKAEQGYEYEFIGYYENNELLATALILFKKIGSFYYGYSPRGFLVDYNNYYLLKNFTNAVIEHYYNKNFAFIKINPEIAISSLSNKQNFIQNENIKLIDNLINCGYKKLKDNLNFESLLPRYNAIKSLEDINLSSFSKNTRNKIKKGISKGLRLTQVDKSFIDIFYNLISDKISKDEFYYKDMYNIFSKTNSIDLFLVTIDYPTYLQNTQIIYNNELDRNNSLNKKIAIHNTKANINEKMNSDKALLSYKNALSDATKMNNYTTPIYIAGALVIKYKNRITFEITGFDPQYKRFAPNYFLHYAIMTYYKNDYKYANLNGMSGDLSSDSSYRGLNRFKMGFNPTVFEYIGEFDLIINNKAYNYLLKNKYLIKEFNKNI